MREIRKTVTLKEELDFYELHLSIINCLLPVKMTPMEIITLSAFMTLKGDIAKYRFNTTGRKLVMQKLKLSPAGLGNYLRTLKEKEFLTEGEDGNLKIWPLLIPESDEQIYSLRLINSKAVLNGAATLATATPQTT